MPYAASEIQMSQPHGMGLHATLRQATTGHDGPRQATAGHDGPRRATRGFTVRSVCIRSRRSIEGAGGTDHLLRIGCRSPVQRTRGICAWHARVFVCAGCASARACEAVQHPVMWPMACTQHGVHVRRGVLRVQACLAAMAARCW